MRSHPRVIRAAITTPTAQAMPVASRRELLKLFDNSERYAPPPAQRATVPEIRRAWNTCAGSRLRLGRGLPSLRVAAAMGDLPASQEAPSVEIPVDEKREIAEPAEPRSADQAIESEQPSDSGQVEIVAPAPPCEAREVRIETETNVPHETIVSDRERSVLPTFRQAQDAHAREFLTRVLTATGGERRRAAEIAGINRTHLQSLLKRHKIVIPYDPKARGRRRPTNPALF